MNTRHLLLCALPALAWAPAAAAQTDPAPPAPRTWETTRRSALVTGQGPGGWQNTADSAAVYTLAPDPDNPGVDLLTAAPAAAAVGATGRGRAALAFGPDAAAVFTVDRATGVVARADGQPSAALDALNRAAANALLDPDTDRDATEGSVARAPLDAFGIDTAPARLTRSRSALSIDGGPAAQIRRYQADPISFTTADGDTVVLRAQGFAAVDPSGAVVLTSGQSVAGQALTAAGDLVPFAFQSSSRSAGAGGGADLVSPAARAALDALLPPPAALTDPGFTASGAGPAPAPPAWAGAVFAAAQGLDALGTATTQGTAGATALNAAAVADRANAAALNAAAGGAANAAPSAAPDATPAFRGLDALTPGGGGSGLLAQTLNDNAGPFGSGAGLLPAPGAAAEGPASELSQALAGRFPAAGGAPVSGSSAFLAGAIDAAGPVATGGQAIGRALGTGNAPGNAVATALGGAAVFGIDPQTGAPGRLPDLTTQVLVSGRGQERTGVAETANPMLAAMMAPMSSGGFSSVTLPPGLFTFSVFDNGGVDNEDLVTLTLTNNGVSVPVMAEGITPENPVGNGINTVLFFPQNGSVSSNGPFNAATNPARVDNRFSATLMSGTAVLSAQGISSATAGNGGGVAVTSPVEQGLPLQTFELRQFPSSPADPDLDFARLGINVTAP